jgi:hypothetical protein
MATDSKLSKKVWHRLNPPWEIGKRAVALASNDGWIQGLLELSGN